MKTSQKNWLKQNLHLNSRLHRSFAVLLILCLVFGLSLKIKNTQIWHPTQHYFYTEKHYDNSNFCRDPWSPCKVNIAIPEDGENYRYRENFGFEEGEYYYNRCYFFHRPIDLALVKAKLRKTIADDALESELESSFSQLRQTIKEAKKLHGSRLSLLSNPPGKKYRGVELCNSGMAQNEEEFSNSYHNFKRQVNKLYENFYKV